MAKNTNAKQEFLNHINQNNVEVFCATIQKGDDYGDDEFYAVDAAEPTANNEEEKESE